MLLKARSHLALVVILSSCLAIGSCTIAVQGIKKIEGDRYIAVSVEIDLAEAQISFDEIIHCEQDLKLDTSVSGGWTEKWIKHPYVMEKTDSDKSVWRLRTPIRCDDAHLAEYPFSLEREMPDGELDVYVLHRLPSDAHHRSAKFVEKPVIRQIESRHKSSEEFIAGPKRWLSVIIQRSDIGANDEVWQSEIVRRRIESGEQYIFIGDPKTGLGAHFDTLYSELGLDSSFILSADGIWPAAFRTAQAAYLKNNCRAQHLVKVENRWKIHSNPPRFPIQASRNPIIVSFGGRELIPHTINMVYDVANREIVVFYYMSPFDFERRHFEYMMKKCAISSLQKGET